MNTSYKLGAALLLSLPVAPFARAQSCTGNTDFSGHYMFVATRQLFSTPAPPPERVTNAEPKYSATSVGSLLRGALGNVPFAATGRLVSDGQGGLFAAPSDSLYISTKVGTYTVSAECTLSMTITDGFLPFDLIAPLTPGVARFTGILQTRGGESNLIQSSAGDGTTLLIARAHQANSCSNSSFSGAYGFAANGVQWTVAADELKPESLSIFSLVGRVVSDGAGSLFLQDGTVGIPLQFAGTYTLQPDCTGTAKITDGKTTRNLNFVMTQANPAQNFTAIGVGFSRPVMRFVIADPKMAVTGVGREATGRL